MTSPLFLFAPGAGAPSTSAWMKAWVARLATLGPVVTLDYPYMLAGRRSPDPLPKLVAAHRAALESARKSHEGPVILAGKSMGSRVGCHVSLEARVDGLVCFGYPLRGASARAPIRNAVLESLDTPVLFVSGTRDSLCPLDLLDGVRKAMKAKSDLVVVEGGDHSLVAGKTELKRRGETQDDVDARILAAVAKFVREMAQKSPSIVSPPARR